jgi:hypothetical protein
VSEEHKKKDPEAQNGFYDTRNKKEKKKKIKKNYKLHHIEQSHSNKSTTRTIHGAPF